jgi:hypothetical protein
LTPVLRQIKRRVIITVAVDPNIYLEIICYRCVHTGSDRKEDLMFANVLYIFFPINY